MNPMLMNKAMLPNDLSMLGQAQPIDASMLGEQELVMPPLGDNYNEMIAQRPQPMYEPPVNNMLQDRRFENPQDMAMPNMPQQPMTGVEKFQSVINALQPLSDMIDDNNARSVLPATEYLKYRKEKEDSAQQRQAQLLDSLKLDADIKYRQENLDIQREQNAIAREALIRGDARPTAMMQNFEFLRNMMPNASPTSILPFATGAGLSGGLEYDSTTGELSKPEKPLPASALKMQSAAIDDLATAEGTQQSLTKFIGQIDEGKLDLGLASNLINKARNGIGLSSEESRNLQSFQSSLEKLRNDSLRLNAGVQTDGDAQRAWSELVANINDPDVVKQRLEEIRLINERGAALKKLEVDTIRQNFGVGEYDWNKVQSLPSLNPTMDDAKMKRLEELRAKKAAGDF